jgi:hypothetical protein
VTDGKADVLVGGIVATTERRQRLDFCAELLPTRHVVLNRRPSPPVASLEALRLQRVGTVPETSWARTVAEAGVPPAQVVGFRDLDALREGLRSGKVNALVLALGTALLEIRNDESAQTGLLLGPVGSVAWGVRKGNGDLLAALDNYVRNLRRTATWDRLIVKYGGRPRAGGAEGGARGAVDRERASAIRSAVRAQRPDRAAPGVAGQRDQAGQDQQAGAGVPDLEAQHLASVGPVVAPSRSIAI